jgi:zinc and cadmium transporter
VSAWSQLLLYSTGVVLAAVAGGSIPLWSRNSSRRLEVFLSASAGVMLGVLGGHMLPEAFEAGPRVAWAIVGGFLFMLIVERFVLPHALHAPHAANEHTHCDPALEPEHVRADAAGIGAFLGLALHTLSDGLALGAAVSDAKIAPFVFLAIVAHKIPSAFALSSIFVRARVRTARVVGASVALGSMVGIGGALFLAGSAAGSIPAGSITPYAVAFSAGSFLHVAVTDLLPDLHWRGGRKWGLVAALLCGLGATVLLSWCFREPR